jgi:hypothetical protein
MPCGSAPDAAPYLPVDETGQLACSLSRWPFVHKRAQENVLSLAAGDTGQQLCIGTPDDLHGSWTSFRNSSRTGDSRTCKPSITPPLGSKCRMVRMGGTATSHVASVIWGGAL